MEKLKLFLDLDGVIINLDQSLIKFHNWPIKSYDIKEYNFEGLVGMSHEEIFSDLPGVFWEELPMYSYSKKLVKSLVERFDVYLLSSPVNGTFSEREKWIQKYMPDFFQNKKYLLGPAKSAVSEPGKILIDDYEKHVDEWEKEGGDAILFPQPWNRNRRLIDRKLEWVELKLKTIAHQISLIEDRKGKKEVEDEHKKEREDGYISEGQVDRKHQGI